MKRHFSVVTCMGILSISIAILLEDTLSFLKYGGIILGVILICIGAYLSNKKNSNS